MTTASWLNGFRDQTRSVGTDFGTATASDHTATGFCVGTSGTVFVKFGSGLAIYVEPEQIVRAESTPFLYWDTDHEDRTSV
jgi:hypothetical protein